MILPRAVFLGRPAIFVASAAARFGGIWLMLLVSGCSRAPSQDIMGSFFPAWMLCAAIGIVAAVIVRKALIVAGLDEAVVAPPVTYVVLAVAVTLLVWLLRFGD